MAKRPAKGAAPPRRAVSPQAGGGRAERRTKRSGAPPGSAWSGPFIPYPPPAPSRTERVTGALRRYGLVGLVLLAVPLLAVWLLTSEEPEPVFELSAEERAELVSPSSAADAESSLSISTSPSGAEVRLDFDSIGVSPVDRHALAAGTYLLSIAKEGYLTYDTLLTVEEGEIPVLHLALQAWGDRDVERAPAQVREERGRVSIEPERSDRQVTSVTRRGSLRVTSQPSAAAVWLDGQRVGETPLSLEGLRVGTHTVEVRTEDGRTYVEDVEVEPEAAAVVQATFAEAVGGLTVLVQPWGSIYIDGRLHRQDTDVQYQVQLPVGVYQVRVEHPVLGSATREVRVTPGTPQRLLIDLNAPPSAGGAVGETGPDEASVEAGGGTAP